MKMINNPKPFQGAILQLAADIVDPVYPIIVPWNDAILDTSSFYNAGDNTKLTIPVGFNGYISLAVQFNIRVGLTANTQTILQIRKNEIGTGDAQFIAGVASLSVFGGNPFSIVTGIFPAVAGDFFDVRFFAGDSSTIVKSGEYGCRFSLNVH